jgi:hypothetical protein
VRIERDLVKKSDAAVELVEDTADAMFSRQVEIIGTGTGAGAPQMAH